MAIHSKEIKKTASSSLERDVLSLLPLDGFHCELGNADNMAPVMRTPILFADGYSYEKDDVALFMKKARSPKTNQLIPLTPRIPNEKLERAIKAWGKKIAAAIGKEIEQYLQQATQQSALRSQLQQTEFELAKALNPKRKKHRLQAGELTAPLAVLAEKITTFAIESPDPKDPVTLADFELAAVQKQLDEHDRNILDVFECTISTELMTDPVCTTPGTCGDRHNFEVAFGYSNFRDLMGPMLKTEAELVLTPNRNLLRAMTDFLRKRSILQRLASVLPQMLQDQLTATRELRQRFIQAQGKLTELQAKPVSGKPASTPGLATPGASPYQSAAVTPGSSPYVAAASSAASTSLSNPTKPAQKPRTQRDIRKHKKLLAAAGQSPKDAKQATATAGPLTPSAAASAAKQGIFKPEVKIPHIIASVPAHRTFVLKLTELENQIPAIFSFIKTHRPILATCCGMRAREYLSAFDGLKQLLQTTLEELELNSRSIENPVLKEVFSRVQKIVEHLVNLEFIQTFGVDSQNRISSNEGFGLDTIEELANATGKFRTFNKWKDQAFARLATEGSIAPSKDSSILH